MILTNKTKERRVVRFGVGDIVLEPLATVTVPKEQEENAKRAFKSALWQRFFDNGVFSLDDRKSLTENEVTVLPKVKAPKEFKQRRGRAEVTQTPEIIGTATI